MADSKKLGLWGLAAIVFGSMIGGGIFNIAQNMAAGAALGPIMISWVITAVGILFLVMTFKTLADARPDLNAGIYQYAQVGFGNYVGFNIAWGYWLCVALGNVAYAVMMGNAFGAFWPVFNNNDWQLVVFGLVVIWLMYFIVANGVQTASALNNILTVVKFASLVLIAVILIIYFKVGVFTYDFWGHVGDLGSIGKQIESTMLVTLWCFIGIEGAVMMSARAKNPKDVGKASILGFLLAWVLYVLISVLCFGVMKQPEMAKLDDPSVAYVLKQCAGDWAYYIVVISVIISLVGGFVAWTLVCAQTPYEAAIVKILPRQFLKENKKGMPAFGLAISSIVMSIFMVLVATANNVYMAALDLTTVMVAPAYFFSGLFLFKASFNPGKYLNDPNKLHRGKYMFIGAVCTIFCAWIVYAGGLLYLLITSIFYIAGIWFYVMARRQDAGSKIGFTKIFAPFERWILFGLSACAIISIILLIMGKAHF